MPLWLPRLLLGGVIAFYWARVLKMVARARRKRRNANLIPAELLGKWLRAIWIPVVILWVAHPFITTMLPRAPRVLQPLWNAAPAVWLGLLIAAACLAGSLFCWKKMGRAWRMGIDPAGQPALITDGPYAWFRHPIYALSQTMMAATALAIPSPLLLLAGAIHITLLHWEASREEEHLARIHGERYEQYRLRTGGFIPKTRG